MREQLNNIKEKILETVKKEEKIEVAEIFWYGDKKIEFMLLYSDFVISVSVVDDMSYDFTVYDNTLDNIVFNNTQFNVALDDLSGILLKDIDIIKNKRLYI